MKPSPLCYDKFDLNYAKPIRQRWIKALRSGKYKQGQECLVDSQGRCCPLGVLCMEFYEMYPGRVKKGKDEQGRTTFDGEALVVPFLIAELVGLQDRDGKFRDRDNRFGRFVADGDSMPSLAFISDYGNLTLPQFADLIENPRCRVFIEG